MDESDLSRLTDFDFEKVCKDLYEDLLRVPLEIFSPGKDGGTDLRHVKSNGHTTVIQCKHWMQSGRAKLIKHYRDTESHKVATIAPDRYILATTASLTVNSKEQLSEILGGYLKSTEDIHGLHEIVEFLRARPAIVARHIRLWLNSTGILSALLNRDVMNRGRRLIKDIDDACRTYVPNPSFDRARAILEDTHGCIIVGVPGIGKSTLAHVLLATYAKEGYSIVDATGRLEDIDRIWEDTEKQIFFLDDFLGEVVLDRPQATLASRNLKRLLRDTADSNTKRLVMTSREYLVVRAKETSESLTHMSLHLNACFLDIGDYTWPIRAAILYNHVFFAGLSDAHRVEFAQPIVHLPIIKHPNYSPRLIEHAISEINARPGEHVKAGDVVMENLRNPRRLWEKLIEEVFDSDELAIVFVLFSVSRYATIDALETAWRSYLGLEEIPESSRRFRRALNRLQSTMIRQGKYGEVNTIEFHNPSVRDYLLSYVREHTDILRRLLDTAIYFDQVQSLWSGIIFFRHKQSDFESVHAAFAQAASKLALTEHTIRPHYFEWADRISTLIAISNKVELPELDDVLGHLLEDTSSWVGEISGSELIEFAAMLGASRMPHAKNYQKSLYEAAAHDVVASSILWEDVYAGHQLLTGVGSPPIPHSAITHLEDSMWQLAADELAEWAYADDPPKNVGVEQLTQIVEYASDSRSSFDGLDEAIAYLDSYNPPDQPPAKPVEPYAQDIGEIAAMFATLLHEQKPEVQ